LFLLQRSGLTASTADDLPPDLREKVPGWQAKVKEAIEACQEGGSLTEGNRWNSLQMGREPAVALLQLKLEPIESLKTISEKLVSICPEDGEPLWRLASEYLKLDDPDEALLAAKRAADMPVCYMMEMTEVRIRRFARELASTGHEDHLCQFLQGRHAPSSLRSYTEIGRQDLAASLLAEKPALVDWLGSDAVQTLLSLEMVKLAEERAEADFADTSLPRDDRIRGFSQLRDFLKEKDPVRSEELQRRIDSI
jgi:hypothetical protein